MASDRPKRKAIPERVKLAATLICVGMVPDVAIAYAARLPNETARSDVLTPLLVVMGFTELEWDHDPPLALRAVNAAGDDYEPPQLDPRHITPRGYVDHRTKTTGTPPGQKVVTVANGDIHRIAKAKRLEEARLAKTIEGYKPDDPLPVEEMFRGRPSPWPKGRKMQSRGFQRRTK